MMKNIGQKIRSERKSKGLTLDQLSSKAGVSKAYLSELENDLKKNPSSETLLKIAVALNVSLQYLLEESFEDNISVPLPSNLKDYALEADLKYSIVENLFKLANIPLANRGNKRSKQITKEGWKKIHETLVEQGLLEE